MDRQGITPYLCCRGAADAIAFYRRAFGAVELDRMVQPDGRVGHAEIEIEHAVVMLADEFPELEFRSPLALGGSPVLLHLDVADVDRLCDRARGAGARVLQPVEDRPYGERRCKVADPYGHVWSSHPDWNRRRRRAMRRRAKPRRRTSRGCGTWWT